MTIVETYPAGNRLYGGPFRGQRIKDLARTSSNRIVGHAGSKTLNMSVTDFLALTIR